MARPPLKWPLDRKTSLLLGALTLTGLVVWSSTRQVQARKPAPASPLPWAVSDVTTPTNSSTTPTSPATSTGAGGGTPLVPASTRIVFPIRNHKKPNAVAFLDEAYHRGYPDDNYATRGFWHTGVDMNGPGACSADLGNPVYAMTDGLVRYAGDGGGLWGNVVVIEHRIDGKTRWTRYGHVIGLRVRAGQTVRAGEQIAQIGKGGWACAHLHFDYFHAAPPTPGWWPTKNGPQSQVTALLTNPTAILQRAVEP